MIYIVSAGIDEGKTRKMEALYRQLKQGDGWISRKILSGKEVAGYELERLSTAEKIPLTYKRPYVPASWQEVEEYGPFVFSTPAFVFADLVIDELIEKKIQPVFIDEIGPLELRGKGFYLHLQKVLKAGPDLYIAVRSHCVHEVVEKFTIKKYRIISLSEDTAG
jgi:nucleoside-triphosphatase THEP1